MRVIRIFGSTFEVALSIHWKQTKNRHLKAMRDLTAIGQGARKSLYQPVDAGQGLTKHRVQATAWWVTLGDKGKRKRDRLHGN